MKNRLCACFIITFWIMGFGVACADVNPGDVITADNADSVAGMVPDFVLDWVKSGKITMKIASFQFDRKEHFLPHELEAIRENAGKFSINEKGEMLDASGKHPHVTGVPFPLVDPGEPAAFSKMGYNCFWSSAIAHMGFDSIAGTMVLKGDRVNYVTTQQFAKVFIGTDPTLDMGTALKVLSPQATAGFGVLTRDRFAPDNASVRYVYLPATRKVRRLSGIVDGTMQQYGSIATEDESGLGGPVWRPWNVQATFKSEREMLIPYVSASPGNMVPQKSGYVYAVTKDEQSTKGILLGKDDPSWTGAPWAPVNIVWIKATVWEYDYTIKSVEGYYAFPSGTTWVDPVTFCAPFKTHVVDKKPDRNVLHVQQALSAPDGTKHTFVSMILTVEGDSEAAINFAGSYPGQRRGIMMNRDIADSYFTRGGFMTLNR